MENFNPLVSILIITYNSSKYVEETLYSAINQTYKNIEIIVSDDCSTDNTVEICKKFFLKNSFDIKKVKIISTPKNSGIPANCNNALKEAKGEWIKIIAGDDILDSNCINHHLYFINQNKNSLIITSKIKYFSDSNYFQHLNGLIKPVDDSHFFYSLNSDSFYQFNCIIKNEIGIPGPSLFFSKKIFEKIGYFDEKYKFVEDLPFIYKVLKSGIKIYYLNKITVYYRLHEYSISSRKCIKPKYIEGYNLFIKDNLLQHYSFLHRLSKRYNIFIDSIIIFSGNKGVILKYFNKYARKLNPVYVILKFNNLLKISSLLLKVKTNK